MTSYRLHPELQPMLKPAHVLFCFGLVNIIWSIILYRSLFAHHRQPDPIYFELEPNPNPFPSPYTSSHIATTIPYFKGWNRLKLFVFNGANFTLYNVGSLAMKRDSPKSFQDCYRCYPLIPLVASALYRSHSARFQPGKPPVQLLLMDHDYPEGPCFKEACPRREFAPIIAFSSSPKNLTHFPTLRMFPSNTFSQCLLQMLSNDMTEHCRWQHWPDALPRTDSPSALEFAELRPQVIWRGSDWPILRGVPPFQHRHLGEEVCDELFHKKPSLEVLRTYRHHLNARWQAVMWTWDCDNKTDEKAWIDARFSDSFSNSFFQAGHMNILGNSMTTKELAAYRYQLDIGGGGGTTWGGTLTKLLMPGVLLHHETATVDHFYAEMKPWVHYIPVKWDLSDLKEKFEWAEAHPSRCVEISQAGTKLALRLLSRPYLEQLYKELFEDYLGELISAYQNSYDWPQTLAEFRRAGVLLQPRGSCDAKHCLVQNHDEHNDFEVFS